MQRRFTPLFSNNNIFVFTFLVQFQVLNAAANPVVTINDGSSIYGVSLTTRSGRNISGFLGIPYAEPPLGDLR